MKLQKIFLLLLLISVAIICTSCGEASQTLDCFDFEAEDNVYNNVYQLDGELVASNEEENLVAIETEKAESNGNVKKTVTVYDLVTGKNLFSEQIDTAKDGNLSRYTISVDIDDFPIVQVVKNRPTLNSEFGYYEDNFSYTYYFVGEDSSRSISSEVSEPEYKVHKVGNVYLVSLSDALYWVDGESTEIIRKDRAELSDSYIGNLDLDEYFEFDAEYNGYLYAWEFGQLTRTIMVYDKTGMCAVKYNHPNDVVSMEGDAVINPSVFVLNNGNILVQECYLTAEGESYDFIYRGNQITLKTKIIDYVTGSVTDVDFDALILDMQSRYDMEAGIDPILPFKLGEDYANMVVYTPIVDRTISALTNVSVVDDSFEIVYTFINPDLSATNQFGNILFATEDYYVATVSMGKEVRHAVYDYKGQLIKLIPLQYAAITDEYVVLSSGIYDWEGKLVFDFEKSPIAGKMPMDSSDFGAKTDGKSIYITVHNMGEQLVTTYRYNPETKALDVVSDGVKTEVVEIADGYIVIKDLDDESYTLQNADGKVLLKTQGYMQVEELNDVLYVTANVYSDSVVYVINDIDKMPKADR